MPVETLIRTIRKLSTESGLDVAIEVCKAHGYRPEGVAAVVSNRIKF